MKIMCNHRLNNELTRATRRLWNKHIITQLGEMDLAEITPYVLQCYVTELLKCGNLRTGKGLSANSVNSIITVIQNTLKTAYSLGIASEYTGDGR